MPERKGAFAFVLTAGVIGLVLLLTVSGDAGHAFGIALFAAGFGGTASMLIRQRIASSEDD
jgi:hypothetical protein